jgi:hypothetical protein
VKQIGKNRDAQLLATTSVGPRTSVMVEDEGQNPAPYLPDDLLVEILSRLPAKSLCRFKCASRSWRALTTDPAHRRRFAQTLSGIFFSRHLDGGTPATRLGWGFTALPSTPPPHACAWWGNGDSPVGVASSGLPCFLPSDCAGVELLDSCNGLLLLRCSPPRAAAGARWPPPPSPPPQQPPDFYVVCNPAAAGEWVALPQPSLEPGYDGLSDGYDTEIRACSAALSFDPSVSSHFHVFQIVEEDFQTEDVVRSVEIYSSETCGGGGGGGGEWVMRESGWELHTAIAPWHRNIYFNGFQHFTTLYGRSVAMVDVKGQAWREVEFPVSSENGFVGHSQGFLLYVDSVERGDALAVYALEDHGGDEWTFKHRITKLAVFGQSSESSLHHGQLLIYCVAMFHPDCDWILLYGRQRRELMSYDMNKGDVRVICSLREVPGVARHPFFPFVPMYSRTLLASSTNAVLD